MKYQSAGLVFSFLLVGCSSAGLSTRQPHYAHETSWECNKSADLAALVVAGSFTRLGFSSVDNDSPTARLERPVRPLYADALTARILAQTANRSRIDVRISLNADQVTVIDMRSDLTPAEQTFVVRWLLTDLEDESRSNRIAERHTGHPDPASTQPAR